MIGLKVTMYYLLLVDIVERDADHCEDSNNALFWDKIFLIAIDDISKTLVAFFHYNAWKIILIFDKIYDFHDHWVIKSS
jgi:low temperature requirement protein LtrA